MEHTELWIIIMFVVAIVSGMFIAVATEGYYIIQQIEPLLERDFLTQSPENVTLIPDLGAISFQSSLDTCEMTIGKGQSQKITIMIYSPERVNLSFTITKECDPRVGTPFYTPELPPGITACFDQNEITVEADSEVTVNLTLGIGDEATSGTYPLEVWVIQDTPFGSFADGTVLRLTIL